MACGGGKHACMQVACAGQPAGSAFACSTARPCSRCAAACARGGAPTDAPCPKTCDLRRCRWQPRPASAPCTPRQTPPQAAAGTGHWRGARQHGCWLCFRLQAGGIKRVKRVRPRLELFCRRIPPTQRAHLTQHTTASTEASPSAQSWGSRFKSLRTPACIARGWIGRPRACADAPPSAPPSWRRLLT